MTVVTILLILLTLIAYAIIKNPRQETLYIYQYNNTIEFVLTDEVYLSLKLNENEDRYEVIKDAISARAFELKKFVDNIMIMDNNNQQNNKELLKILKQNA